MFGMCKYMRSVFSILTVEIDMYICVYYVFSAVTPINQSPGSVCDPDNWLPSTADLYPFDPHQHLAPITQPHTCPHLLHHS